MTIVNPTTTDAVGAVLSAYDAVCIVSPGKDEEDEKNQDRLAVIRVSAADGMPLEFAAVCDGVTTSPFSEKAAEYVASHVNGLFSAGGVERVAQNLTQMRRNLLEKPLQLKPSESAMMTQFIEEIVREKYSRSFQTTVSAVCIRQGRDSRRAIKAIGCGDSALFIFRAFGQLIYNNVKVANEYDLFNHASPFTAVLPDSFQAGSDNVLFDFTEFDEDVHLLLCSDGLYDCFRNFNEIREWLETHLSELQTPGVEADCLSELHQRLAQRKGDDDISFVWLRPASRGSCAGVPKTDAVPVTSPTYPTERSQSFISSFLHRFRHPSGGRFKSERKPQG